MDWGAIVKDALFSLDWQAIALAFFIFLGGVVLLMLYARTVEIINTLFRIERLLKALIIESQKGG